MKWLCKLDSGHNSRNTHCQIKFELLDVSAIDWEMFERELSPLYCQDNGRPAEPVRLMVGLLILKHIRDFYDESVVV